MKERVKLFSDHDEFRLERDVNEFLATTNGILKDIKRNLDTNGELHYIMVIYTEGNES